MKETWKHVTYNDYDYYLISDLGRVKNGITGKVLKPYEAPNKYLTVTLYNRGKKKTFYVHRLVAQAFISNPNNLHQINHKDENRKNNRVTNLEWCTSKYNCNYGNHNKNLSKSMLNTSKGSKTPITLENKETHNKVTYKSLRECSRSIGVSRCGITNVLKGGLTKSETLNSYIIYYKNNIFDNFNKNIVDDNKGKDRLKYIKKMFPTLKVLSKKDSIKYNESIKVKCIKHNRIFTTSYANLKAQKYACLDCYIKVRSINAYIDKDEMQHILSDRFKDNISIVNGYKDKRTICTLYCRTCEQTFRGIPYNVIKNKGNGCPNCSKSKYANLRKRDNKGMFI